MERGILKSQWVGNLAKAKNNRIFGGRFFAELQSVAISQWSLRFFALANQEKVMLRLTASTQSMWLNYYELRKLRSLDENVWLAFQCGGVLFAVSDRPAHTLTFTHHFDGGDVCCRVRARIPLLLNSFSEDLTGRTPLQHGGG